MTKPDKYAVYYVLVDKKTGMFENDVLFVVRRDAVQFTRDFVMPNAEVLPIYGWTAEKMSSTPWQIYD